MPIECTVIDAGARYGLHPTWAELRGLAEFHLFEMDKDEAGRLTRKYAKDDKITVYPLALYKEDTTLRFSVSAHSALSSIFAANDEVLAKNDYMLRDFKVEETRETEARSLDSLFRGRPVHFLKLDIEGAEYDVLCGATELLASGVLGVRSEVLFSPVFEGAPLFGDLNKLLLDSGFELLNLDYAGAGNKAGRFTLPNRYGKLVSSDAVWVVPNEKVFSAKGEALLANVVRFAIFLLNNGATDLAVEVLQQATTREGVDLAGSKDPLVGYLHKKILLLFKSLLSLPMIEEDAITGTYRDLFGKDFPLMNRFYELEMFQ